jgi:hypothetical protein
MQKEMQSIIEVSIEIVKLYVFAAEHIQITPKIHELKILIYSQIFN